MFEYVASGLTINRHRILNDPKALEWHKQMTSDTQCFSFLYNGFQEKANGELFKELYDAGFLFNVHADSGGLQMITRNLEPNAKLRQEVYENQAKYATVAMSFDEIPLKIVSASKTTAISNLNCRLFDMENLVTKAKKSGQNIKEQVEFFNKVNTKCKPLMILQGNDLDTYKIWTEEIMSVFGEENLQYIDGLALAPTSIGMGLYEDCVRAIALKTNPYNKNKVHLLGIGSITRMLPFVMMNKYNWFGEKYHISYDSTSHTRGLWGSCDYSMRNNITLRCGTKCSLYKQNRKKVYEDMSKHFDLDFTFDMFNTWCDSEIGVAKWKELTEDKIPEFFSKICTAFLLSSVKNFMLDLDAFIENDWIINNKEKIVDSFDGANNNKKTSTWAPQEPVKKLHGTIKILNTMKEVKTHEDGKKWLADYGKILQSKSVPKTPKGVLPGL